MNHLNKLTLLFLSIILLLGIITVLLFTNPTDTTNPPESDQFYCGTIYLNEDRNNHPVGEQLFKENCKCCHKIHEESVGPALSGVVDRRPRKWLYAFIHNSADLIDKKDTMAVNIYRKYKKAEMIPFPNLTEAEIDSILIYIGK
jgi:cytochrome c551/c552